MIRWKFVNLEFTGNSMCVEKTWLACLIKSWEKEKESKKIIAHQKLWKQHPNKETKTEYLKNKIAFHSAPLQKKTGKNDFEC